MAAFGAPLLTGFVIVTLYVLVQQIAHYAFPGTIRFTFSMDQYVGLMLIITIVAWIVTVIIGLPIHWLLGQLNMRTPIWYGSIGLILPAMVLIAAKLEGGAIDWSSIFTKNDAFWSYFMCGSGGSCALLFWFLVQQNEGKEPC